MNVRYKTLLRAALKGELMLHIHVSKYFVHILYGFLLVGAVIWVSMKTDAALSRVEKNKALIHEQELVIAAKRLELTALESRASVANTLKKKGSALEEPEEPAINVR